VDGLVSQVEAALGGRRAALPTGDDPAAREVEGALAGLPDDWVVEEVEEEVRGAGVVLALALHWPPARPSS
jgi:hypothetical protein